MTKKEKGLWLLPKHILLRIVFHTSNNSQGFSPACGKGQRENKRGKWSTTINNKVRYNSFTCFWMMALFLWGCGGEGGDRQNAFSSGLGKPEEQKTLQKPSCNFEVIVAESDFCVIQGRVHDLSVSLASVDGVCHGSTTLSVKGFPPGVSHKILPSPKVEFTKGTALATVRIDTDDLSLKEMATSTLTITAKREGLIRTAKTNMLADLPYFDFSLKASPFTFPIHHGDSASTTVKVKLLGAACSAPSSVKFSLDSSELPSMISHEVPSEPVTPPGKATFLFKASSGTDYGLFKATISGCCTGENDEKPVEIALNIVPSDDDEDFLKDADEFDKTFHEMEKQGKKFKVESLENFFRIMDIPIEEQQQILKDQEDELKKGYQEGSEQDVMRLRHFIRQVHPINVVLKVLTFEPAPIENTPFKKLKLEGAYYDGVNLGGRWTNVSRIFSMSDGALVELTENDFLNSGGGGAIYTNVNETIHGFPATFVVIQAPSGKALSSMAWTTQTKDYSLRMEGNVRKNGRKELFLNLARSVTER